MRTVRFLAATAATALALSACGGGGETPSDPDAAVGQGLQTRIEEGAAFELTLDGDLDAFAAEAGIPREELDRFVDGGVRGAFQKGGGFALTVGRDGGWLELRFVDESLYARADLDAMAAEFPEMGDPSQIRAMASSPAVPAGLADLAQAAAEGRWVGLTGLSQEQLNELANQFGGTTSTEQPDMDAITGRLEEEGLLDGEQLTERYLVVEGEGPAYDVTVRARAFAQAMVDISREINEMSGMSDATDVPDPADVPETVEGFQVTVDGDKVTEIRGDLAAVAESIGEDAGSLEPGQVFAVLTLSDLGDQLQVPGEAVTVSFEEALGTMMGSMFGGLEDGLGELPTEFNTEDLGEFDPDELPSGFELPSDFPTELLTPQS